MPDTTDLPIESGAHLTARFGALVRQRREALGMLQSDLAYATRIGRRFIIELEGGKPSCHLGKALIIAQAVGLHVVDLMESGRDQGPELPPAGAAASDSDLPERPDLPEPLP